jgi:RNA polymerase sigma factor (sigma-70 family)
VRPDVPYFVAFSKLTDLVMTERELIEGVSRRDRASINYLVNTYQTRIIKTSYYFIGNLEDAEDLSQEIFLEIIKSISSFRGTSSFSTWLYRIIVNRSINIIRKNNRRNIFGSIERLFQKTGETEDNTGQEPSDDCDPLNEKETKDYLNNAISGLPENQRIAFVLNKYEELSYKEIADVMNLSVSSVESLIHRAKNNLQKKLVNYFSQYSKK